ncbi:MAG: fatty acid desaturase [Pseudobdellovibrionaceae bacterium]|nr:fatty acid desaturase [Bdellovibrionales bacterium]USN47484.1 MAG: fatty acid desaturase [Pseudobdellovibrionaceae bacterium]
MHRDSFRLTAKEGQKNIAKGLLFIAGSLSFLLFMRIDPGQTPWTVTQLLLSVLAGFGISILLVGLGVLGHEAMHRNLHPNKKINDFFGVAFSTASLLPFYAGKKIHLSHHQLAHTGENDPEYFFHRGSPILFVLFGAIRYSQLHFNELFSQIMHWQNLNRRVKREVFYDLFSMIVAFLFVAIFVHSLNISALLALLGFHLTLPLVFSARYAADHRGLPSHTQHQKNQAHAWVVKTHPILEWIWSHINYHGVHHMYPAIPHGKLKTKFELTQHNITYPTLDRGYVRSMPYLLKKPYFA